MNLVTNVVTGTNQSLIKNEILFFVAVAKATGKDLIMLEATEKQLDIVAKILRFTKREGIIQLFIFSDSLNDKTTEVEYLKNKYPTIGEIRSDRKFFLLKI